MRKGFLALGCAVILFSTWAPDAVLAADSYKIDPVHTAVTFKIAHLNLSWTHGRFNEVSGHFVINSSEPTQSSFSLSIKSESVDTANSQRDAHLRGPDFFNVKQFPAISFTSKSVKPVQGGYEVSGEMTLHGVTRPVTFTLSGGKTAEFPPGVRRTGYSTQFKLKRSDFGMDKMQGAIGEDVYVAISFEGVKS